MTDPKSPPTDIGPFESGGEAAGSRVAADVGRACRQMRGVASSR